MKFSERRRREIERKLQPLADAIDRVTEADRKFFERRKDRAYRVRLASRVEIAANALIEGAAKPPEGHIWYVAVRQVKPGLRLRAGAILPESIDPDLLSERECEAVYEHIIGMSPDAAKIDRVLEQFLGRVS